MTITRTATAFGFEDVRLSVHMIFRCPDCFFAAAIATLLRECFLLTHSSSELVNPPPFANPAVAVCVVGVNFDIVLVLLKIRTAGGARLRLGQRAQGGGELD